MKYLVKWSIQGHNMSDSGSYPTREIEAEDLSDLYNKVHDCAVVPGYFGDPSEIYELSKRFTHKEFLDAIHKEVMSRLGGGRDRR